ncbi:MAG: DUF5052 family protein [Candidatus Microsaccharimonas sp.]
MTKKRLGVLGVLAIALVAVLTGCSGASQFGGDVSRALNGVEATMSTYDSDGALVDEVKGKSFNVARDTTFDSTDSKGASNADSSVVKISLGEAVIHHVGSTLIIAQKGITQVAGASGQVRFTNNDSGSPVMNYFYEANRNLWHGAAKTLMIRSQDGKPIAVFAGDEVEAFATDVPKSTAFQVDEYYVFVYHADYDIYPNSLFDKE